MQQGNPQQEYTAKRKRLLLNIEAVCNELEYVLEFEEKLNLAVSETLIMRLAAAGVQERAKMLPVRNATPLDLEDLASAINICNTLIDELSVKLNTISELSRAVISIEDILHRKDFNDLILGNIFGRIVRVADFITMAESKELRKYELPINLVASGMAVPRNAWLN